MKTIAYIRVSTHEQSPDRQINGLSGQCDELHVETISAVSRSRPVYDRVMKRLKPGDVFAIWDLDRAYRSTRDALNELDKLKSRDISIYIANLAIDTATLHGKLIYTIISAHAEFERGFLSQRTKEGMEAARQNGKRIGRPPKISDRQVLAARRLLDRGMASKKELALRFDVNVWTLTRRINSLNGA